MPPTRVLLVELQAELSDRITQGLSGLGVQVTATDAEDLVKRLVADAPELVVVNLELSRGSGFGLVNRVRRMEALASLKTVLVAEKASVDAIDTHRRGPTPAAAYVRRGEGVSNALFAEQILEAAKHVLGEIPPVSDVDWRDIVELDQTSPENAGEDLSLEKVIGELGPFRVLRRLRDEDGGAVFACHDGELRRNVAIKLMPPEKNAGEEGRERLARFQREGRVLALLQSPYVLGVYGAGTHRGIPYLVRELIDGETLAERVARQGPLDLASALARVRETALALKHAAAAGVIHRDVRPENIRVVDGHAKLARFAMGKRIDDPRITRGGLQMVDMTYVAPERVRGHEDARGDIYALGVTLYFLLIGKSPYRVPACVDIVTGKLVEPATPLIEARPSTPFSVSSLAMRLLAEDPTMRPPDWGEVVLLIDDAIRTSSPGAAHAATTSASPSAAPLITPSPLANASLAPASSSTPTPAEWNEPAEPSAVHGTLRLMSVVEIVQSLELSKKTAVVTLPSVDVGDGKLAFENGRLVHASVYDQRGVDAFFILIARKSGAFRVDYDPNGGLEKNIDTPVAGLLLEAARRSDVARASRSPLEQSSPALAQPRPSPSLESSWTLAAMASPASGVPAPDRTGPDTSPIPMATPSTSAAAGDPRSGEWSASLPQSSSAQSSSWSLPVLSSQSSSSEPALGPDATSSASGGANGTGANGTGASGTGASGTGANGNGANGAHAGKASSAVNSADEAAFLQSTPDVRLAVEAAAARAAAASADDTDLTKNGKAKKARERGGVDDDSVEQLLPGAWKRRRVSTPLGLVAIAAVGALCTWGGFQLPPLFALDDGDDASSRAIAALFDKQNAKLHEARTKLAELEPKLSEFETKASASASASEAQKKRVTELQGALETSLKSDLDAHHFLLRASDDGSELIVEIPEIFLFASDGDEVTNDGKALLGRVGAAVADGTIRVEGHTDDSTPRGKHKNNWGLAGARAVSAQQALAQAGVAPSRLQVAALADTVPLASNKGPKGRARNRRIELHLLAGAGPATTPH